MLMIMCLDFVVPRSFLLMSYLEVISTLLIVHYNRPS